MKDQFVISGQSPTGKSAEPLKSGIIEAHDGVEVHAQLGARAELVDRLAARPGGAAEGKTQVRRSDPGVR